MVIRYLYAVGAAIPPDETDAPLVIDPNTVLTNSVPLEGFQVIARWRRQVAQLLGLMDLTQLALSDSLNIRRQFPSEPTVKKLFRILVEEAPKHSSIMIVCR
jgi:hypothetical protein